MGWTSMPMNKPVKEWFREYWEEGSNGYKVLDSALINYTEMYGAIKKESTGEVFCAAFRVNFSPKSEYNFMYKPMTEHVGPVIVNCPKRIFDLLTDLNPETAGYANEWRKRIKEKFKKRDLLKKLKTNNIIKTNDPLHFAGLGELSYFRKLKLKGYRNIWEALNQKFEPVSKVRVNMKDYEFEIIN